ncbi:MAG: transcription termination factor Rho [Clostridia bacterium]|nr:transcription termination factor Rho [Clostridia bacterium]
MFSKENFESMTVIELRKVARENGVTLSAGISKQGIIDRLCEKLVESEPAPAPAPQVRRAAAIVSDDEDTPVLTPNAPFTRTLPTSSVPRPVAPQPTPSMRPVPQQPTVNRGNVPGTNKPVFSLEGVRAWHNPRTYQQPSASPYGQQRPAPRPQQPATPYGQQRPVQRSFQTVSRFGPDAAQTPASEAPAAEPSIRPEAEAAPQPTFQAAPAPDFRARTSFNPLRESTPAPAVPAEAPAIALPDLLAMGDVTDSTGVLEIHPEGYGFLRSGNFLQGSHDVYVSNAQIRRFHLKNGDLITGKTRPQRENDRYCAMLYITEINGVVPDDLQTRVSFESLTALPPDRQIKLADSKDDPEALQLIDLVAPIGFGQRALIIAPPRSGKTQLLRSMAASIHAHYPETHIISLLLGERPEELYAARKELPGQVVYATFDEPTENQLRVSELALEHALRLVEQKKDVILFVDSLTSLCRAYSDAAPQNARMLQGGLAAGAVNKPKRLFGAARKLEEGGSLTVIAVMTADTLSPLDNAIADEFHGAANMKLRLVRSASALLTPMIDLNESGTRNAQLMLNEDQLSCAQQIRVLAQKKGSEEAIRLLLPLMKKARSAKTLSAQLADID